MNALFTVLAILILIASILLTIVVLLQNGKGGGLASNFVAGNQTFGVRQTADLLEKITWGLAVVVLALSIITNFTYDTKSKNGVDITEQIQNAQAEEAPAFPAAPSELPAAAQENPEQE